MSEGALRATEVGGKLVIVRVSAFERVPIPEVPVMVKLYKPVGVVDVVDICRVD